MAGNRQRKNRGPDRGNLRPDRNVARRESAVARQAAWDALTPEERAAQKDAQGFSAEGALIRERAKAAPPAPDVVPVSRKSRRNGHR